jgi:6-pyruvoyltetrahydropterin/6-carboxytetrahydropterin synthase
MKAHLTRRYWFAASHRLHSDQFTERQNQTTYGKCNNPYGHGHNYFVEVTVSGHVDKNGMICDLGELDGFVEREVLERYGHQHLNTLPEFERLVPTTENLCIEIYDRVQKGFSKAKLERIRIEETMNNSFEYSGGDALRY